MYTFIQKNRIVPLQPYQMMLLLPGKDLSSTGSELWTTKNIEKGNGLHLLQLTFM